MDVNVIKMARKLGKAIQEDERYLAYHKAKEANDADEELQKAIGEFNLVRQNLGMEINKPDDSKDQAKIESLNSQAQELHSKIMANPNMEDFTIAKTSMDSMISDVSTIISMCCDGEDPETCQIPQAHAGCGGGGGCRGCGKH